MYIEQGEGGWWEELHVHVHVLTVYMYIEQGEGGWWEELL